MTYCGKNDTYNLPAHLLNEHMVFYTLSLYEGIMHPFKLLYFKSVLFMIVQMLVIKHKPLVCWLTLKIRHFRNLIVDNSYELVCVEFFKKREKEVTKGENLTKDTRHIIWYTSQIRLVTVVQIKTFWRQNLSLIWFEE